MYFRLWNPMAPSNAMFHSRDISELMEAMADDAQAHSTGTQGRAGQPTAGNAPHQAPVVRSVS